MKRLLVPPTPALVDMMAKEAELGIDPRIDPPPPPGPPVENPPLIPVGLPEPDWRAEEKERARQAASELEPSQEKYPAKPAGTKKSKTPHLDEVLRWRKENP